ncbi:MAG: DUF4491 family protein [Anaerolineales bacterium]|nr:DUF4491 family protein [Anaerolineales bacterium]
MMLHFAGLILAFTTFVSIGLGHEFVRRLYPVLGTKATPVFWALGLVVLYASLTRSDDTFSGILGVFAVTLIWDGIEFLRQKKRVERGEA